MSLPARSTSRYASASETAIRWLPAREGLEAHAPGSGQPGYCCGDIVGALRTCRERVQYLAAPPAVMLFDFIDTVGQAGKDDLVGGQDQPGLQPCHFLQRFQVIAPRIAPAELPRAQPDIGGRHREGSVSWTLHAGERPQPGVVCILLQGFLDDEESVVLGVAFRAARRTGLDLACAKPNT